MRQLLRSGVERLLVSDLRRAFRRIWWLGSAADLDPQRPVVFYANHHTFFDGHLVWYISRVVLGRTSVTWMREWDRFPFLGLAGALPFPSAHLQRRTATIRATRRLFEGSPSSALILFPEGEMHPAEEGVDSFEGQDLIRLSRVLPTAQWCPFGIHTSWRSGDRPDAFLAAGVPADAAEGDERTRLCALLDALPARSLHPSSCVLEGRRSRNERWDFQRITRYFR